MTQTNPIYMQYLKDVQENLLKQKVNEISKIRAFEVQDYSVALRYLADLGKIDADELGAVFSKIAEKEAKRWFHNLFYYTEFVQGKYHALALDDNDTGYTFGIFENEKEAYSHINHLAGRNVFSEV